MVGIKKRNKGSIGLILFIISIVFIAGFFIFYGELKEAKGFCESQNMTYSFKQGKHLCDGYEINKYKSMEGEFWTFFTYENNQIKFNLSKNET